MSRPTAAMVPAGWAALARGLCLHLDCRGVHAGGLEQGAEQFRGPFGAVEGDPGVPAVSVAVVAGDTPDLVADPGL